MSDKLRIVVGSDDAGFDYKETQKEDLRRSALVATVTDVGVDTDGHTAYPAIAIAAAEMVARGDAARAMLLGHTRVALANTLKGDNPFSDACLIAMDYGREPIVKDDWKKVFQDDELDKVITRMLRIKEIKR
ncbi:phosphogluconate dehydrogenase C-terminal domain-containing protein [Streptomyces sp. NPDC056937]|uniref:phosphogluconate dehydrogenase C-terminal domain-containing protein n=1 Tax=Streptomyces sp. NPDC056937 TaxID=3345969 RepID=UPI0036388F5A